MPTEASRFVRVSTAAANSHRCSELANVTRVRCARAAVSQFPQNAARAGRWAWICAARVVNGASGGGDVAIQLIVACKRGAKLYRHCCSSAKSASGSGDRREEIETSTVVQHWRCWSWWCRAISSIHPEAIDRQQIFAMKSGIGRARIGRGRQMVRQKREEPRRNGGLWPQNIVTVRAAINQAISRCAD